MSADANNTRSLTPKSFYFVIEPKGDGGYHDLIGCPNGLCGQRPTDTYTTDDLTTNGYGGEGLVNKVVTIDGKCYTVSARQSGSMAERHVTITAYYDNCTDCWNNAVPDCLYTTSTAVITVGPDAGVPWSGLSTPPTAQLNDDDWQPYTACTDGEGNIVPFYNHDPVSMGYPNTAVYVWKFYGQSPGPYVPDSLYDTVTIFFCPANGFARVYNTLFGGEHGVDLYSYWDVSDNSVTGETSGFGLFACVDGQLVGAASMTINTTWALHTPTSLTYTAAEHALTITVAP